MDYRTQAIRELEREKLERRFKKEDARRIQASEKSAAYAVLQRWREENKPEEIEKVIKDLKDGLFVLRYANEIGPLSKLELQLAHTQALFDSYIELRHKHITIQTQSTVTPNYACATEINNDISRMLNRIEADKKEIERKIGIVKQNPPEKLEETLNKIAELERKFDAIQLTRPQLPELKVAKKPGILREKFDYFRYTCNCDDLWGCFCDAKKAQEEYANDYRRREQEEKQRRSQEKREARIANRIRELQRQ